MKATSRPRDDGGGFARRGHANQLSISDTSHHVTEAIGDMYGDDEYSNPDSRPLSFLTSNFESGEEQISVNNGSPNAAGPATNGRPSLSTNGSGTGRAYTTPTRMPSETSQLDVGRPQRSGSLDQAFDHGVVSPRSVHANIDGNAVPLQSLDYESNPAAVAQELSNLQALRRMSMDVANASDPDLPSFGNNSFIPSVAPKTDDEDDPSRMFWVPAAVHPELAPMEFKTFIENKVQSIKRRSGDQTAFSPELQRSGSLGGGLRRKKSMLSRQIDNSGGRGAIGYQDGSEQLERKRSMAGQKPELTIEGLKEFDTMGRDSSKPNAMETLNEIEEDLPILPSVPGQGLRRSTHTTYRKGGSLKRGERLPYSKRIGAKVAEAESENPSLAAQAPPGHELSRVQSEPIAENFSRPNRPGRRGKIQSDVSPPQTSQDDLYSQSRTEPGQQSPVRRVSKPERNEPPVPQIREPPPIEEQPVRSYSQNSHPERGPATAPLPTNQSQTLAEEPRSSRRIGNRAQPVQGSSPSPPPAAQSVQHAPHPSRTGQTLSDLPQPSLLPGNKDRTDSLTFIPTLQEDTKLAKKKRDDENSGKKGSGGWGWFKNSEEKDKKRSKDDDYRKAKARNMVDKPHDNARLDVLNTAMDQPSAKGRESLVLDRDSIDNKLLDERKRDGSRRAADGKKEKDGLFSSLFGGGKKKGERDAQQKKSSAQSLSPDHAVYRPLRPDVDYPWTRFTLLEERAIYRMAHIKLANPRRALLSQVLLSNFMYSYLAKVQQMHPHMQVPQSAQQKKLQQEAERKQKEQERQYAEAHEEEYKYDYHQGIAQYAESGSVSDAGSYVEDSPIYQYDQAEGDLRQSNGSRPQSRAAQHDGGHGQGYGGQDEYYMYDQAGHGYASEQGYQNDDGEMW